MSRYAGKRKVASGDNIDFYVDLTEIINMIANGLAMSKQIHTKKYQNSLFDVALRDAEENFNISAAAYASATGKISHMYEWGTRGINTKRSSMRPDPMSKNARLWEIKAEGAGFNRNLTYFFLPSFATVPKPTTSETNMRPEVISKMKDHVFRWKAEMMEWGRLVELPARDKFYLIPVTKNNRQFARPHDIKRGYMLTKGPIDFYAGGHKYANNFTSFFTSYWESIGLEDVNKSVTKQFENDFIPNFNKKISAKPNRPVDVKSKIDMKIKEIQKETQRQAEAREKGIDDNN